MRRSGAVVAGHICLDIIPELPALDLHDALEPGAVTEVGGAVLSTGGVVSNTGLALHTLGIPVRLVGRVGDDQFGQIILNLMREYDPALVEHMLAVEDEASSYTIVLSPPDADRMFLHCAGANRNFGADDVPYAMLETAQLFHFGYPPVIERMYADDGAELAEMYRRARATGAMTSLDMALPDPNSPSGQVDWRHILTHVLPYVDVFLPSLDELLFMVRRDVFESGVHDDAVISAVAGEMLALGARIVVLKLGDRGLYLRAGDDVPAGFDARWRNRELWAPCFVPQPLAGTTGAGDATIAGFLAAILREQPVEAALTSAVAVGACNVEAADALSGVQSWDATQARIAGGWARSDVTINAPGWSWDAEHMLWVGPHDATRGDQSV